MPTRAVTLHDRAQIAALLRTDIGQHLYAIGDLDDFFWPSTIFYALEDAGTISQPVLAYDSGDLLILHALCSGDTTRLQLLIGKIQHLLPAQIYTHLSPGVEQTFAERYTLEHHGHYLKMLLTDRSPIARIDTSTATQLAPSDTDEVLAFYQVAYPGNWFDPRMLETRQFIGIRRDAALVCVAGIHVYSPSERVAAIGSVATLPPARGHGLATVAMAALCNLLSKTTDSIGLNVRADNLSAVGCYERLGFTTVGNYGEWMLRRAGHL